MPLLITKAEIAKYRELAPGVRDDKINPYIEDAENADLQELLGESFLVDLQENPGNHESLLAGGTYSVDGETYRNPGLRKVLALFAYSRYILNGSATDTPFGYVEKTSQNSKAVDAAQKRNIYNSERELAYKYFSQVKLFMIRTEYASYDTEKQPEKRSFRISKIV